MDIPELSMSMANTELMRGVSISMMKKSLEQVEQMGAQLTEMMESVPVSEGLLDVSV